MLPSLGRPLRILLVEDNPGDAELTRIAFRRGTLENQLNVVEDGEEALDYLFRRGRYENADRPDLVLLDLNLPGTDGREVLRQVKADESVCEIPFVVLTTSDAPSDVKAAYQHHANAYMTKPQNMEKLSELVRRVEEYWFSGVTLPTQE